MAQTFNNGESLASIRAKLNANAGEINGKANLSGGNTFSGLNVFSNNDTFFGDQTKNWVNIGNLGTGDNTYIDTQGVNTNVPLIIRTKGNGAVSIEADTYIDSPTFVVNGQNWTSAWTSYTPALINSTGATATITNAKLIPVGKIGHINIRLVITSKGTSSGDFGISMPVTSISDIALSGGLFPINTKDSRGFPVTTGSQIKFTKQSQAALVSWADVSVNDEVTVSGVFEIA